MERIVKQAFLYDFYGELLTKNQQQVYEDFVLDNLSLSEIAQERGISRQSVHDMIKRCDKILEEYESKLHLVEKFLDMKKKIKQIRMDIKTAKENIGSGELCNQEQQQRLQEAEDLIEDILNTL